MARKQKAFKKYKNKYYRAILVDPDTLEEKYTIAFRPIRILVSLISLSVLFLGIAFATFYFTPLKFTLPGYGEYINEQKLALLKENVNTLEGQISIQNKYIRTVRSLISGIPEDELEDSMVDLKDPSAESYKPVAKSNEDSLLRNIQEKKQRLAALNSLEIVSKNLSSTEIVLKDIEFYPPLRGNISKLFDKSKNHYGVDVIAPQNSAIKSIRSGIVLFSGWTRETGNTMIVQHEDHLVSFYKHNSKNLFDTGDQVNAGEAIAIIGNSGEQSTGPHLHFELWYKGISIDPTDFIIFE